MKPDWMCPACQIVNFARRHVCFKCNRDRPRDAVLIESEGGKGGKGGKGGMGGAGGAGNTTPCAEFISAAPCEVLLVRGINMRTTEEAVSIAVRLGLGLGLGLGRRRCPSR